jgi:lysophospholipase L1-like esterase
MHRTTLLAALLVAATAQAGEAPPSWVEPMRAVHAKFRGTPGYVAQLGDSITYSMAFWSPMGWADPTPYLTDDGLPKAPPGKRWRDLIQGTRAKGPDEGNYSSWRVENILSVIDKVLAQRKPEAAILMVGTNDIAGDRVPAGYRPGLESIIQKCLAAGCVPLLNTLPPKRGETAAVADCNQVIRELAQKHHVPLVDYGHEILRRQPGMSWDGTLISDDGVHPTAGETHVFSTENLMTSGYALRTWLNFLTYRQLYFHVLAR